MTTTSNTARIVVSILLGVLVGGLTLWLIQGKDEKKFAALKASAICVMELPEGVADLSATFTNTRPIEMFHVGLRTRASDEALSVSISGAHGVVSSVSRIKAGLFGLGRAVQPGNYTVSVRQETGGKGGTIVIADAAPVYVTGWQIWSRAYVSLLALSGICLVLLRKAAAAKTRTVSIAAFHGLLLGFVLIFVYLLFHEGGHAVVQIAFGHFDLARSDFWGIHGHPHSGAIMGPQLQPWQQTLISCAGPMLPTFVGIGLFLLWVLPWGRKLRSSWPFVNMYFSALVVGLVFSEAVCGPAYLLGLLSAEGDVIGYVARTGGPVWLVRGALGGLALLSLIILWVVGAEIRKVWTMRFAGGWEPVSPSPSA